MFGMLSRDTNVKVKVLPNVRRATLMPLIEANNKPETHIHANELKAYDSVEKKAYFPKCVNDSAGKYISFGDATVNSIGSFWRHRKKRHT